MIPGNPYAPDWYTPEYQTQVRLKYQARGYELKGCVVPPVKIEGDVMYFPFMGELAAYEVNRNDTSNADNAEFTLVPELWKHYEVQFVVNQVDLDRTTIGMVEGYAGATARALGRKHTRVIFSALEGLALPAAQIKGDYTTGFTLDAAATMISDLYDRIEDDSEMAVCPLPHTAFSQLMTFKEFSSRDYVGEDLPFIKRANMKVWRNCLFFALPKRKNKVDPYFQIAGVNLDFHMWIPSAIGSGGLGDQVRSYVTWDNKRQGGGWDHKNIIGIGAKVLQESAVERFKFKEDSIIDFT
ncbi:phage capsid protein [Mesorhizobium sp.]|uniref:phage capsid protein n=1 Tax=Mesorhizobium sp. TaxID=1871066 RepID=UPI00120F64C3|nr:phage capsid protein [Mesorhizobium sp.]TIL36220.1 MAG: hypothetical protein E5Y85_00915 [Mesorhizobium sp.]